MPYRRKYSRYPKRRYYKKYPRTKKTLRKEIKKVIQGQAEHKYAEGVLAPSGVINTGTIAKIAMPSQGDAFNNREGDQITLSSIKGKWNATATDTTNLIRFMIIKWLQDDSVEVPSLGGILQSTSVACISPYILDKPKRAKFRVLYDSLAVTSVGGADNRVFNINVYGKKLGKVKFGPGLLTGKGTIWYLAVSDSGAAGHPAFSFDFIYKWTDM